MLDLILEEYTAVLIIVALAVLFLIVFGNTKRNVKRSRERKQRNFRKSYFEKKKEQED